MVKLNKIYTRTGDSGQSGLVDGTRRPKYDPRFEAIGDVDEANASIGLARLYSADTEFDALLNRIQNDLFDLGADLATPLAAGEDKALRIIATQVTRLEQEIDAINEKLEPLNSFILPGGSALAAHLHQSRVIVRRAERVAYALAKNEAVNAHALQYLNRLSDLLFVAARAANNNGKQDVLWIPGANRE
ncbi:MAG: cob(I)yrinic acid a,c-diamide adenosyltransferase [Rickettsiales bacterium]|nr:cob(I)yrinic acid a,c-diamide adenosyltransferase [Rickettsiales bacterium]